MQVLIRAEPRLEDWEHRAFWPGVERGPGPGDARDVYERDVGQEPPGEPEPGGVHRRAAAAVLRYEIFSPRLITGVLRRTPVEVGDTVGIVFRGVPGLRLFFAARVVDSRDGPSNGLWTTGFTYRTLHGHPEYGEETFCVEKDMTTGRVRVALRSWSRPGTRLARIGAPVLRMLQVTASRGALAHLARIAAGPG